MTAGTGNGRSTWGLSNVLSLTCLTLAAMFAQLDRSLFGFVMPAIKEELVVSDTVLGLLAGAAFTSMYLLLAIPVAWLADRTSRKWVILAGFAFWNLATALSGFVTNIVQLGILRVMVGAGESTNLAPSKSIVADLFPKEARATALYIVSAAPALSAIAFVPIIGWVANSWGWREAFISSGVAGMIVAVFFLFFVQDRKAGASDAPEGEEVVVVPVPLKQTIRVLFRSRTYILLAIASSFMAGFTYTTSAWETSFLVRVHGFDIEQATRLLGPVRGAMGLLGVLLGIYLARRLGPKESRRILVPLAAALGLALTEACFLLSGSVEVVYAAVFCGGIFYTIHVGIVYHIITTLVPPTSRGVAIALFIVFGTIWGQSLGPFLVGGISDLLEPSLGQASLRYGLMVSVVFACIAAIFFILARRTVDGELAGSGPPAA